MHEKDQLPNIKIPQSQKLILKTELMKILTINGKTDTTRDFDFLICSKLLIR